VRKEIISLIYAGRSNEEIAEKYGVPNTVVRSIRADINVCLTNPIYSK